MRNRLTTIRLTATEVTSVSVALKNLVPRHVLYERFSLKGATSILVDAFRPAFMFLLAFRGTCDVGIQGDESATTDSTVAALKFDQQTSAMKWPMHIDVETSSV